MDKPPASRQDPERIDPQREADLLERWLDNQRMDMELQKEQMRLKNRVIDGDKSLAEKSIEAQLEDRSLARTQTAKLMKYILVFMGVVVFMLLVFGGYVIYRDKESVLTEFIGLFTELLKYAIGATTGYFIAKARFGTGKADDSNPD